jgi:hypothetical protein
MKLKCEKCNKIFYAAERTSYCDNCKVQMLINIYKNNYTTKKAVKILNSIPDEPKERKIKEKPTFLERKNNMIEKVYYDWKVIGPSDNVVKLKIECVFCGYLRESEVSKILNNRIPLCKCKNINGSKKNLKKINQNK